MAFGSFDKQGGNQPMSEINTTPLVDVMLVLMIIFMITAPLLTHAIKVDLPSASSAPTVQPADAIIVSLDAEGRLFWNDEAISAGKLSERLAVAAAASPQPELQLRADRETRYQALAGLMAEARKAGIVKLGFITVPDDSAR